MLRALPLCLVALIVSAQEYTPPSADKGAIPTSGKPNPNPQWTTLLGNLLYFYDAQRSGTLSSNNRVPWRNSSALDDGKDVGVDLTGGFYDAGDYIKATFPLSYTLMTLCWGALDTGQGYELANQTGYLDTTLRWGLDWMMKAHPNNDTLYVQVGDSQLDNNYWGGDQNIPQPRPSVQVNQTKPGTDVTAAASAAFAACNLLYTSQTSFQSTAWQSRPKLQDQTYATKLLSYSDSLYTLAINASGGMAKYSDSVPSAGSAYPSTNFGDDITIATLFQAAAHNSSSLAATTSRYYTQYNLEGSNDVFNWDSKEPAISVLYSQLSAISPSIFTNATRYKQEADRYLLAIADQTGPGKLTKGGLLYYDGGSDAASLNPAINAAFLMQKFAPLSETHQKKFQAFASMQLDYVLGNNPMSVPYVVGSNPNSPSNPHSATASGGTDIGRIDTVPVEEAYVLYGAVVGGPDKDDNYYDIRSDYIQTEVALDYNAPLLSLVAAQAMVDQNDDPYYTRLQAGAYAAVKPTRRSCGSTDCWPTLPQSAQIAMGVVISVVGLIIVGSVVYIAGLHGHTIKKE